MRAFYPILAAVVNRMAAPVIPSESARRIGWLCDLADDRDHGAITRWEKTMMRRLTLLAASTLVLVMVLFVGTQASALPAGCDPSRPGVAHGADATNPAAADDVPCLTYGFFGFGEANPVVTSSGAVMYGGAYFPTPQEDCVVGAYEISSNIARSVTQGGDWDFLPLPTNSPPPPDPPLSPVPATCPDPLPASRGAGDPRLWRDPLTDRVFLTNIGNSLGQPPFPNPGAFNGLCQTEISYTDDGGANWTNNPDPVGFGCPAFDFPHLFTAPRTTSPAAPPGAYPNVVYICKRQFIPPAILCWKSLDSLATLIPIPAAGPNGAQRGTGGLDGTIYGVVGTQLRYSADEGATWTAGSGVIPVPAPSRPVVDSAGTVYVVGISNGKPQVTYTRDRGATWSTPVAVQAPGVNHAHDATIAVPPTGASGPVAVAYVSSDTADTTLSPYNQLGGVHNGYIATTDDIFAADPVFHSVQVDSDDEPFLPYGFPNAGNTTTPSRADYIGVFLDEAGALQIAAILAFFDQSVGAGDLAGSGQGNSAAGRLGALRNMLATASEQIGAGTPWAYFYKDLCASPGVCDCPKPGVCAEPDPHPMWTNWLGSVATVDDGIAATCQQLRDAQDHTDGAPMPSDLVTGPATAELADRIGELRNRLGCG